MKNMKYTRKQITEAIQHWENKLMVLEAQEILNEIDKVKDADSLKQIIVKNQDKIRDNYSKVPEQQKSKFKQAFDYLCYAIKAGTSFIVKHIFTIIKLLALVLVGVYFWKLFDRSGQNALDVAKANKHKEVWKKNSINYKKKVEELISNGDFTPDQKKDLLKYMSKGKDDGIVKAYRNEPNPLALAVTDIGEYVTGKTSKSAEKGIKDTMNQTFGTSMKVKDQKITRSSEVVKAWSDAIINTSEAGHCIKMYNTLKDGDKSQIDQLLKDAYLYHSPFRQLGNELKQAGKKVANAGSKIDQASRASGGYGGWSGAGLGGGLR